MPSRRQFLGASAAAAVTLALSGKLVAKAARPLKILVMGGTGFLGPHFVQAARARGHVLTLFNRGKTNPGLFKDIEQLHGDRKLDLSALEGRQWDAVLDTSAYLPGDVTRSATLLSKAVGQYLIVSTVSVYAETDKPDADEDAKLIVLPDPTVQQVTAETYGGLKALSEQAAQAAMPGKVTVVRPGLIVGPGDNSDRFTYWPARVARGGEVLAPDSPEAPTQFIDARDLAAFMLHLIETRTFGVFNADARSGSLTMGALLAACQRATDEESTVQWVPADFLEKHKVSAWADMPCWLPATGENAGFGRTSVARAEKAGLTWRPLDDTVRDTLAWWRGLPAERRAKPKAGISPEREAAVLAAWNEHWTGVTG
jgi:2'-hydroxyisoflavone reductase